MDAIPLPDPPLTDGELTLRYRREDDARELVEILQDPEIPRWTRVPSPYTLADAHSWFELSEQQRLAGEHLNLLVVDGSDRILGSVGLMREPGRPAVGEIGYWTAAAARGRGVCTRAVVLLRDWAARELGLRRIEILPHADNLPSQRVAERAGFTDTGDLRPAPRMDPPATEPTHKVYAWEAPPAGQPPAAISAE